MPECKTVTLPGGAVAVQHHFRKDPATGLWRCTRCDALRDQYGEDVKKDG